jgi:hypothetical protein
VVGSCALIGGAIDFFIGKKGQIRVRDWLELRWYQVAGVAWSNFGAREAESYLAIFHKLAGNSAIGKRRTWLSITISIFSIIVAAGIAWSGAGRDISSYGKGIYIILGVTVLFSAIQLSLSLSITRLFARAAVKIIGVGIIKNISLFL